MTLRKCATTGRGAMEGDHCFLITPSEADLPASGSGATVDQYALRPTGTARGQLVVFFNGSGGAPSAGAGTSAGSFFGVARDSGLHVLGVSYVSSSAVGQLCGTNDGCFEPTRTSILLGDLQAGGATALSDLTSDEGVFERIAQTLHTLVRGDPNGGWEQFIDLSKLSEPENAVKWSSVIVAGHSQGGGHAALIAKRQRVARVVMLAAPCDGVGTTPATWLSSSNGYATPPSAFRGLWAAGDTTCARAPAVWRALGIPTSATSESAATCVGADAHGAPLFCPTNANAWSVGLQP